MEPNVAGPSDNGLSACHNHGVTSYEFETYPARLSDAERERVIVMLREGAVDGRLSHDTFVRRMGLALAARDHGQLRALTADLPPAGGRFSRLLLRAVSRVSAFNVTLRAAWRAEKLPPLVLPEPGPFPLRIGRDVSNGLRLSDSSASRIHAELSYETTHGWVLRDLGSMNGTFVNGRRVVGAVPVRAGDQIMFGRMSFRLTADAGPARRG
jgi:hypothetical protein